MRPVWYFTGNFQGNAFPGKCISREMRFPGISREISREIHRAIFPGKRLPKPKKLAPGGGVNGRFLRFFEKHKLRKINKYFNLYTAGFS